MIWRSIVHCGFERMPPDRWLLKLKHTFGGVCLWVRDLPHGICWNETLLGCLWWKAWTFCLGHSPSNTAGSPNLHIFCQWKKMTPLLLVVCREGPQTPPHLFVEAFSFGHCIGEITWGQSDLTLCHHVSSFLPSGLDYIVSTSSSDVTVKEVIASPFPYSEEVGSLSDNLMSSYIKGYINV